VPTVFGYTIEQKILWVPETSSVLWREVSCINRESKLCPSVGQPVY